VSFFLEQFLCFLAILNRLNQKVLSIIGTDTGGSVRVPASYCGILGFRPSHGAISTAGVIPLVQTFDTVGKKQTNFCLSSQIVYYIEMCSAKKFNSAPEGMANVDDIVQIGRLFCTVMQQKTCVV
jgi:hypothetical protein